ncbi:hypothetical protein [Lachnobacterium bovis]|uniref:hypothetical protein n=1 Tax=Lachnobacterium bovis TaxID=140626 RepID=UPI00048B6BFE|nr:hypothetical protein [Lachnobacterium bovis]
MTTGGRFSDGFLGEAVNGTICALSGGTKVCSLVQKLGQGLGGAVGAGITDYAGGERNLGKIGKDMIFAGIAQEVYGLTMGNAFEFGRSEVDVVGKRCIDFFDYPSQYATGTIATCLSKIGDKKDPKEEENVCNTNVEKK